MPVFGTKTGARHAGSATPQVAAKSGGGPLMRGLGACGAFGGRPRARAGRDLRWITKSFSNAATTPRRVSQPAGLSAMRSSKSSTGAVSIGRELDLAGEEGDPVAQPLAGDLHRTICVVRRGPADAKDYHRQVVLAPRARAHQARLRRCRPFLAAAQYGLLIHGR